MVYSPPQFVPLAPQFSFPFVLYVFHVLNKTLCSLYIVRLGPHSFPHLPLIVVVNRNNFLIINFSRR